MSSGVMTCDVLVVGSGNMGAAVARLVRDEHPTARIVMVDAGPAIGSIPGQHLHDSPERDIWETYNRRVSSDIQALYVGPEVRTAGGSAASLEPGMYSLAAFAEQPSAMPGAALGWNVGGMSVHWTAATPYPWGSERFDFGDASRWDADLARARQLLQVHHDPFGTSRAGARLLRLLRDKFGPVSAPGRHPKPLPMAVAPADRGRWCRTGPNRVFPAMATADDPGFQLIGGTVVQELLHTGGHVTGARVRGMTTGTEAQIAAAAVVVCADALRTPQLLYASGIRPEALGRYLNEHAFLSGRVRPDLRALGIKARDLPVLRSGEWRAGAYWVPHSGPAQPFHVQVTETFVDGSAGPVGYELGLTCYAPTEIRAGNRVVFSGTHADIAGMPRMDIQFGYTERDLAVIGKGRALLCEIAEDLGSFDPQRNLELLPPGSSLHYTGTVRMGADDDGSSVCDPDARVWGFDNLYVAGNGVVPTALLCNSTLTGMITAVRAGRSVAAQLSG
jgi:choline dehydrogenase-like flavoprotein